MYTYICKLDTGWQRFIWRKVKFMVIHFHLVSFFTLAGHDGYVILWDLRTGEKITSFYNSVSAFPYQELCLQSTFMGLF